MLLDDLVAEARLVLLEEGANLGLSIEQANNRFAHPRERAVGILANHPVPVLPDEVPSLVARDRVVEQRMHQKRGVLRAYFTAEGHLHRLTQELGVAEVGEGAEIALLLLRRACRLQ